MAMVLDPDEDVTHRHNFLLLIDSHAEGHAVTEGRAGTSIAGARAKASCCRSRALVGRRPSTSPKLTRARRRRGHRACQSVDRMPVVLLAGPAAFAATAAFAFALPEAFRARALGGRRIVAGLTGVAAALAPAAPTGLDWVDLVVRVAAAAFATFLGGRASRTGVTAGAALVALGALGSPLALTLAGGAVGVLVAASLTARRSPLAATVAAGGIVQAAFWLESPNVHGATSALGLLAATVLIVFGLGRSSRRQRQIALKTAVGVVAVLGVAGAVSGVTALRARSNLADGIRATEAALDAARAAQPAQAEERLVEARDAFARSSRLLDSPFANVGRIVPVASQHLRVVQTAAYTGEQVALASVNAVATTDVRSLRVQDGTVDIAHLAELAPQLDQVVTELEAARTKLAATRSPWLVPPIADRLTAEIDRIDDTLDEARTAQFVAAELPALLGADGPRRYFLAIQTPVEIRGSGGLIGNYGEILAEDGSVELGRFGRIRELNQGAEANNATITGPTDYLARYERFAPARTWQNVTMSPHFPSVATVIAELYPQSGGAPIDGVISVDPTALSGFLRLVGPVTVPPWPEPLTAENVEQILYFDQYVRFAEDDRVDFLGAVAEAITRELTTGSLPPPPEIVEVLLPAVRGRHIQLFAKRDSEQHLFRHIGADGALPRPDGDVLAVINQNAGGNKIDWFLRRSYRYEVDIDRDGNLHATLELEIRNAAPAEGLPDSIIGNAIEFGRGDPPGTNRTLVSIYTPWSLAGATLDGRPTGLESETERGLRVYSRYLSVPPGGTVTLVVELHGRTDPDRYRVTVARQPGVVDDEVTVDVPPQEQTPAPAVNSAPCRVTACTAGRRQQQPNDSSKAQPRNIARAGTPMTTAPGGTSRVTTAPAPTKLPSPTRKPCSTHAFEPIVAPTSRWTAPPTLAPGYTVA